MRESISIVNQCLSKMVSGPVRIDNHKLMAPPETNNEILYGGFNSIILKFYTEGFHVPEDLGIYGLLKHQKRETGVFPCCRW